MAIGAILKFILGLVLLCGAVLLAVLWWPNFVGFIKGGLPWLVALIAAVFIMLGMERD